MIYVMQSYKIEPGKIKEYEAIHKAECVPLLKKHGVKVIGVWKFKYSMGTGMFDFVRIHAFENLAEFEQKENEMYSDPAMQSYIEKLLPLRVRLSTTVLEPTDYSPMK